jgi:hypothetical protein
MKSYSGGNIMAKINREKTIAERIIAEGSEKKSAIESVLGEPEPWESWETQLCLWSVGIGIAALVVLGFLINQFLLS